VLEKQISQVIHDDSFRKLEGTWRGLKHLVTNSKSGDKLKIKVLNVPQDELFDDLEDSRGDMWQESLLFKKVYKDDYDTWGGEPVGAIVGDFYFDSSQKSIKSMADIAKVASASHSPFVTSASSEFFGKSNWDDVTDIRDIADHLSTAEYAAWREFRESKDARYVGLTLPHVMARNPYSQTGSQGDGEFAYEEAEPGTECEQYTWMNAAFAMGTNINSSFTDHGWSTSIQGIEHGGAVDGLPLHTFKTASGSEDMKCPTEVNMSDTMEKQLSDAGFLSLVHKKNATKAAFLGAQSVYKPTVYPTDADATASETLAARLPYTFAVSRVAHYLKAIGRQMIGSGEEEQAIEKRLNEWIGQYVLQDAQQHTEEMRAQHPLAAAKVSVEPIPGSPGAYQMNVKMRPHYKIDSMNIDVTLVADVEG
jgi:type VI secretion system protein ImpC